MGTTSGSGDSIEAAAPSHQSTKHHRARHHRCIVSRLLSLQFGYSVTRLRPAAGPVPSPPLLSLTSLPPFSSR